MATNKAEAPAPVQWMARDSSGDIWTWNDIEDMEDAINGETNWFPNEVTEVMKVTFKPTHRVIRPSAVRTEPL